MNTYHYKHFSLWERQKLESLIGNKPILKPIYGQTNHGWAIKDWKWLISINLLVSILKRSRKTIKRELLNGRYETLIDDISKNSCTFSYSSTIAQTNRINKYKNKNKQAIKILKFDKLRDFVIKNLENKQSLKAIAGRSKIAYRNNAIEQSIFI